MWDIGRWEGGKGTVIKDAGGRDGDVPCPLEQVGTEEAAFVASTSGEVTSWKWYRRAGRHSPLAACGVTWGVRARGAGWRRRRHV